MINDISFMLVEHPYKSFSFKGRGQGRSVTQMLMCEKIFLHNRKQTFNKDDRHKGAAIITFFKKIKNFFK